MMIPYYAYFCLKSFSIMQFHNLTVANIKKEAADTVSISFDIPNNLKSEYQFIPGQYLTLKTEINGEDVRRAYSICSAPHEDSLSIAVKQIPNGVFSTFANQTLKVGDKLEVLTPNGHFYADYSSSKNYVGFAAGSGITPMMSIIKHVLDTDKKSKFTLFYGNKDVEKVIFGKELDSIKNKYPSQFSVNYVYSQENYGTDIFYGRIDTGKLQVWEKGLFNVLGTDEFFMCGPEKMTIDIREFLESKQIDSEKVHFELFTTGTANELNNITEEKSKSDSLSSNVKVIIDDEEYEFALDSEGKDILEAGINAGIDLPYSCKGGVCSTCRAKVLEGEATMKLNYSLLDDEVNDGYILTCQAHPKSDKLVVSFDE